METQLTPTNDYRTKSKTTYLGRPWLHEQGMGEDGVKVLVVHDGFRDLDKEIDDLSLAGLPANVEVKLLSVADPLLPPYALAEWDSFDNLYYSDNRGLANAGLRNIASVVTQLQNTSSDAAARLKQRFPSWSIHSLIPDASPERAVLEEAKRWHPDLVVLSGSGLSWFERRGLRALARRLVDEAHASMRIARARVGRGAIGGG